MTRGEVWMADLGAPTGGEQAGIRSVVIIQADAFVPLYSTVVVIPFTANTARLPLPTCVAVKKGDGGLILDSVALCHHMRVTDKQKLFRRLGRLSAQTMANIENISGKTLGL